jgi:hypothetical protein
MWLLPFASSIGSGAGPEDVVTPGTPPLGAIFSSTGRCSEKKRSSTYVLPAPSCAIREGRTERGNRVRRQREHRRTLANIAGHCRILPDKRAG